MRRPGMKGSAMQTQSSPDLHFEAVKDLTRLAWLINFEAVATVPARAGALAPFPHIRPDRR